MSEADSRQFGENSIRVPGFFASILAVLSLSAPGAAVAEDAFTIGALSAAPGERVSGYLEVPPAGDEGTRIPVSIVNGARSGPVLALIAGTHGYEYPGVTALQHLLAEVRPAELTGTLLLVHIANPPSFFGRTVYVSPVDGKNLNRVYPGNPHGTVSERIADVITRLVIEQADYLIDLHGGELVDAFGRPLAEIRAPFGSVVNYVLGTPPVSEGEPVAMVSRVVAEPAAERD